MNYLESITPTQAGIINELLPNGWNFLAHILASLIIFFVVLTLVWRPLNVMLAKRKEYVEGQIKDTENARLLALEFARQSQEEVQRARIESARVIEASRLEGYKMREELETQAKMYAERIKQDAREDIKKQEEQLRQKLNEEITSVAMMAAEKIIASKIDRETDHDLVEAFVKELKEQEKNVG